MGCIVFTALAQGLLTDRYLDGVPSDSRAARQDSTIASDHLDESTLNHVRKLNEIAAARGQKLAQLALQWAVRDPRVTSAVIGQRGAVEDRPGGRRGRRQPVGDGDRRLTRPHPASACTASARSRTALASSSGGSMDRSTWKPSRPESTRRVARSTRVGRAPQRNR